MTGSRALSIAQVAPASTDEWLDACRRAENATFFHTPIWADIFSEYHGGALACCSRRIVFSDGLAAVVPLTQSRRLGGAVTVRYSTSPGNYGGWVAPAALDKEHSGLLAAHLNAIPGVCWHENPFDPAMAAIDIPGSEERFTQAVDLRHPLDELFANANRAHHKGLHKAQREGITVRQAESEADWNAYYEMYLDSLRRWRSADNRTKVTYAHRLFDILRRHQGTNIRLWLAEKSGKAAAGIISLYWNHHAVTWHGAALAEFFPLRPNNLLYWEILLDAHRLGFWWFDCNPSGGNQGVVTFKEYLGARKMRARFIDRRSILVKALVALKAIAKGRGLGATISSRWSGRA